MQFPSDRWAYASDTTQIINKMIVKDDFIMKNQKDVINNEEI